MLIGIEQQQTTIRTAEGINLLVDTSISDNPVVDVLWIPGGRDMDYLLQHKELSRYIQKMKMLNGLLAYAHQPALVLLGQMTGAEQAKVIYESLSMDRLGHWKTIESMIG